MIYAIVSLIFYIIIQAINYRYNQRQELKYRNLLIRREQCLYTKAARECQADCKMITQGVMDAAVNKLRTEIEVECLIELAMINK